MDKRIKNEAGELWIFDYDNSEFEKVREICLSDEKNWLRDNYTKENLKISDQVCYCVQYDHSGKPILMSGIKEYTPHVARLMNRWYLFPKDRGKSWSHREELMLTLKVLNSSFRDIMRLKYDLYFISMQQRRAMISGQQLWWKMLCRTLQSFSKKWVNYKGGLVQVHPGELSTCYQNVVYLPFNDYTFEDWNPKVMSYDEHTLRMRHESARDKLSV